MSSYWFFFLAAKFLKHNRQISKPRTEFFWGYVLCQQDDRFRVWASDNKISGAYYIVNCLVYKIGRGLSIFVFFSNMAPIFFYFRECAPAAIDLTMGVSKSPNVSYIIITHITLDMLDVTPFFLSSSTVLS